MPHEATPWPVAILIAVLMTGAGTLVAVVTRRAAAGRLGVNHVAGIRTAATMRDPASWRLAHATARPHVDLAALGLVVGGLGALPVFPPQATLVIVLAGCAWAMGWVIVGGIRGDRAARERRALSSSAVRPGPGER